MHKDAYKTPWTSKPAARWGPQVTLLVAQSAAHFLTFLARAACGTPSQARGFTRMRFCRVFMGAPVALRAAAASLSSRYESPEDQAEPTLSRPCRRRPPV